MIVFSQLLSYFLDNSPVVSKQANNKMRFDGRKQILVYTMGRNTITQGNGNELWYTIPYHLHPKSTRNVLIRGIFVHPKKGTEKYEEGQKKNRKEKNGKKTKKRGTKTQICSRRRPSPERTRTLLAGIHVMSPTIFSADGPTEGLLENPGGTQAKKT